MGNMDELDDLDKAKVAIAVAGALEFMARRPGWKRQAGSLSSPAAPATYSISGTVYDSDGTTAVQGATVAIGASNTTSAVDGTYSISGLAAGTEGSLTCTKSGYSWTAITVSAMSGNLEAQNFQNIWYAGGGSLASCVAAYQPIGAADLAASKVNLANPGTNNAAAGTNPTFAAATGWTFAAASTQYLTTGVTPASGWSLIVRFSGLTDNDDNQVLAGSRNATGNRRFYVLVNSAANSCTYGAGGAVAVAPELLTGVLAVAGQQGYRNGTADGAAIAAWADPNDAYAIMIGVQGGNGIPTGGTYLDGSIQAVGIYNTTLDATQVAIITDAMEALAGPP